LQEEFEGASGPHLVGRLWKVLRGKIIPCCYYSEIDENLRTSFND
jgi:hypothetical protein